MAKKPPNRQSRCCVVKLSTCMARGSLLPRDYLGPTPDDLAALHRAEQNLRAARSLLARRRDEIAALERKHAEDIRLGNIRLLPE